MIPASPAAVLRFIAAMLAAAGLLTGGPGTGEQPPGEQAPADTLAASVTDTAGAERPEPGEEGPPPPLELVHSGTVNVQRHPESGRRVSVLVDSVLFRQGEQYILADRAVYVDEQEQITLTGDVRGWDPVWTFRADEVVYRGRIRLLIATGNVEAEKVEDGTRITARQVRFDRDTGTGVASGSPYLYQRPGD